MIIVGIDASTSTIGWSVLQIEDGHQPHLLSSGSWKPNPKKNTKKGLSEFEALFAVRKWIQEKIVHIKPDVVVIEDFIKFMGKFSTATVIASLAILNRTVGLAVYEALGEAPKFLTVHEVRGALKKEGGTAPSKEEVPSRLQELLSIPSIVKFKKNRKGIDVPIEESYDEADGIAVALAWGLREQKGLNVPRIKKKKRKKNASLNVKDNQ